MVEILVGRNSGLTNAGVTLITLDATLSQEPTYENKVTSYPVEDGYDVADHVRQEPDILKIEGIISNRPDDPKKDIGTNYVESAYNKLLWIAGRGSSALSLLGQDSPSKPIMVDVVIKHRVMTNCILELFPPSWTNTTGDTMQFSARFKKIRKVSTSAATINYTSDAVGGAGAADTMDPEGQAGAQPTKEPEDPLKKNLESLGKDFQSDYLDSIVGEGQYAR